MINFLRFVGVVNAAIWFGASIFVLVGVPALFSAQLEEVLSKPHVGLAAQALLARFFILQYCCGAIALVHLVAEIFLLGRRPRPGTVGVLAMLITFSLVGGFWFQPRIHDLHFAKYSGAMEKREQAAKSLALWHGVAQSTNLLVVLGLITYLWRVTGSTETARFASFSKKRN